MKVLRVLLALSLCASISAGCSDDNDSPSFSTITINENMTNDGGTVYKEDKYVYEASKLTSHVTTQSYGENQSIIQTTTFAYSGNQATITNEAGNVFTYTLGSDGYATQCTYLMEKQTHIYTFTYSDGYLTQIEEAINGTPFMSNKLFYRDGDLTSIQFGENNAMTCQASETLNNSQLPFMKLIDFYPLSMHMDALYAHLLGKATRHMVSDYEPVKSVGDEESQDSEKTTYAYQTDKQQRVTAIKQTIVYAGLIYDNKGDSSLVESTETRNLSISYQ